jgi:hypothetical protein
MAPRDIAGYALAFLLVVVVIVVIFRVLGV